PRPAEPAGLFSMTDTPSTESVSLSLHDALPILQEVCKEQLGAEDYEEYFQFPWRRVDDLKLIGHDVEKYRKFYQRPLAEGADIRSEEHTSELQSRFDLVCRLLLEKKKDTD